MVFSTVFFLFGFLPLFLVTYLSTPVKYRNYAALLGSIVFYAWGAPLFFFILSATISLDFFLAQAMTRAKPENKQVILAIAVVSNVIFLAYCKYANFFIDNLNWFNDLIGVGEIPWVEVVLPIGISFFTFQKLSYLIDVYRGTHKPLTSIDTYSLYVLLFPQLIAGPIVRYNEIADQLVDRRANETIDNVLQGLFRFIIGLAKKVLIANALAVVANEAFAQSPDDLTATAAWIGALAYTFQIYFDFSGYSDMAIGLGRVMGFKFPENFNFPYIARNITEFWRRWHITLGRWMRDYLYIPLGGNRLSIERTYLNLWVVFLISGFWHGASWTFVVWGAYHGLFLVLDRLFLKDLTKQMGALPSIVLTFFLATIGWVLFRADSIFHAWKYILRMFAPNDHGYALKELDPKFWTIGALAVVFSFMGAFFNFEKVVAKEHWAVKNPIKLTVSAGFCVVLFMLCAADLASENFNPFIYFRF